MVKTHDLYVRSLLGIAIDSCNATTHGQYWSNRTNSGGFPTAISRSGIVQFCGLSSAALSASCAYLASTLPQWARSCIFRGILHAL